MSNIEFIEKVWGEEYLAKYMNNVIESWYDDMFEYAMVLLRGPVKKSIITAMFVIKDSPEGIDYWIPILEVNIEEEMEKINRKIYDDKN